MFPEVKDTLTGKVTERKVVDPGFKAEYVQPLGANAPTTQLDASSFQLELMTSCLTDEKAEV